MLNSQIPKGDFKKSPNFVTKTEEIPIPQELKRDKESKASKRRPKILSTTKEKS
jgi:hypothetical protein